MVNIGIIGVGLVGTELVRQLQDANNPYLTVVGIASSRHMLLAKSVPREWKAILKESLPLDLSAFVEHLVRLPGHSVVVDCTASFEIASLYATWLRLGLSVSTPNKKAFAGPVDSYHEMCSLAVNKNPSLGGSVPLLFHESTVGAGMPVLSTLESLVKTGDTILSIEGTFSGTLSYLFNHYSSSDQRFSDILVKARYLGYTEPDPREDLSGIDVARKVIICGRMAGVEVADQLVVENIVPEPFGSAESVEGFMNGLGELDDHFDRIRQEARKANKVLRYVGRIDFEHKRSSVRLEQYPRSHPLGALQGGDNLIQFTTRNYPKGLIIQGTGAGDAVTAFGVFSDLLRIQERVDGRK